MTNPSWLLVEHPDVAEIDRNPVIVSSAGAVAIDALVVLDRRAVAS